MPDAARPAASLASSADITAPPPASASVSGQAKGPAGKATCVDGAYLHESPAFCIQVPDGYSASSVRNAGLLDGVLFSSTAPGSLDFQVTWLEQKRSVYVQERNKRKASARADPRAVIGKTRDGRGLYVRYEQELAGSEVLSSESVVYKRGTIFWCKAQAFKKSKPAKGFLSACQTLLAR